MFKKTKPGWLIPKKKPNTSKISTRNIVKKHLKEWNMDENISPPGMEKILPDKSEETISDEFIESEMVEIKGKIL